ncbi:structural maintenance of chromosomes protein 6-like [Xenia sp. Carnegie-2017]|uniref:structural maintenance of chromosomes protein 6-like n=1 Tax=Xenia sp. Carnegie-2017 TaxID=2897299 RepID=UPI001F04FEE6|nr:structural maintenance of chromosomes protein 6-like [Xenia sp. Carnegie-2017]
MSKRKSKSEDSDRFGSKRSRILESDEENDVHVENNQVDDGIQSSDSDCDDNCSQNPGFISEQNIEAENGIIEEIVLQNFMCHSHLTVPLSSNVNFIIGRNGSGKSAIMTAIVVGLGGKAASTNRGNSLKGFIKDKCSSAVIKIKLKNGGRDAYKPSEYGPRIIVERRINSDGAGSYKICDAKGNVVCQKKNELSHILDQFNIQIDNPVSILNQDTSRNFLYASDPKKKYKFFLKATQLEQMSNDYVVIKEHQKIMSLTLQKKKETIPEMEKEVRQLQEKYRDLEQLKVLEVKIEDLKKEIAWAQVMEKEKEMKPITGKIKSEKERLPKYQEKIEECQEKEAGLEEEWGQVKNELSEISTLSDELTIKQEAINGEMKLMKHKARSHLNDMKKSEKELENTQQEKHELERRIADITSNAMRDIESERLERERVVREKKEALQSAQFQLNTTNHHKTQLEGNVTRLNDQLYLLRNNVSDARKNVDQTTRRLDELREGRKDSLKRFGRRVPELLLKIETAVKSGSFHKPPRGPIGARINLQQENWAIAVETCLKGLAFAFCCTDTHDAAVLRNLMKTLYDSNRMPQVVVSRFQDAFYDVSRNKPRCSYPTVMDVLQIDDPVIFNCIVDQTSAECVLLIENPAEARDVMFNRTPEKAKMAFAGNGDQIFGGRSAKSYAYTGNGSTYLRGNIDDQISRVEQQLSEESDKYNLLRGDLDHYNRQLREFQAELKKSKMKSLKDQEIHNKILQEVTELEQFEEEALPDVTVLQEDVNTLIQRIDKLTSQSDAKSKEYLKVKKTLEEKTNESNEHKLKIQEVIGKAEPLTLRLNTIESELATVKSHRKHYEGKRNELQMKIGHLEGELARITEDAQKTASMATEYCERVETKRTVKSLESEISQAERRLRAEQQSRGRVEVITRQFSEAKQRLDDVKASMKSMATFCKKLGRMLEDRLCAYSSYRKFITLRANMLFQMMLSQRGYSGKLKLKHKKEELHLLVDVDQAKKGDSKSTKSLSGGERSFATVSFIMALWDAMEAPFRCLDEFDVFMDMVNRRISMDSIMKVAKEQHHRQFILLTPQDMSNVGQTNRVKIFKLQDPDRGQTTLPFRPV